MIDILLFARLAEQVGKNKLQWESSTVQVAELKKDLVGKYSLDLEHVMTAVNEEYVDDNHVIKSGDTVAFIPPVSGG